MTNLSNQFNCPTCGNPQYSLNGFEPHDHSGSCATCGESSADGHWHLTLAPEDVEFYKKVSEMSKLQRDVGEVERTRSVDLNETQDLLDHLKSTHGHGMDDYLDKHPVTGNYTTPEYAENYGTDWAKRRSAYHPLFGFGMDNMPERIPGVRDLRNNEDFELTHEELNAVHDQLHKTYPEKFVNNGRTHRHV